MSDVSRTAILPAHIESTVEAIAHLHSEHQRRATSFQRSIEHLTARVGRPSFIAWLTVAVVGWVALNLAMLALGLHALDKPPFPWLEMATGLAALYMTVMILTTQRRDDELASHREQLTLELAILGDQKSAKIIQLLEELRRDSPTIRDRIDTEAAAMSSPADPQAVLDALKDTHAEMEAAAEDT